MTHMRTIGGTLVAAYLAVFSAQLATAMPGALNGLFQADLNTTGSELTWITSAFMITMVVFELSFGVLGDLFGRRRLMIIGTLLLAGGSAISALAPTVQVLWVGAATAGLGAGAIFPSSLALVAAVTPHPASRARGIAIWSGSLALGGGLSSVLGAFFAQLGSWRLSFSAVVVLVLVVAVVAALFATESTAAEGRGLDMAGQATLALGLILVLYGAVQGPTDGWASPNVLVGLIAGAVLLVAFLFVERRAASPIIHLEIFANRSFSIAALAAMIGMASFTGLLFSHSMWLGPLQHLNPMQIAVPFVLLQAPTFVLIPVVSRLLQRLHPQWLLTCGFFIMACGALLASRLDVTQPGLGPLVVPDLLIGVGFTLALSSFTAVAINTVPPHLAGMASATTNLLRDLGMATGPIFAGAIAFSLSGPALGAALQTAPLPAEELVAAGEALTAGGPLAVNGLVPGTPGSTAAPLALEALGDGFATVFLTCAILALIAAALTLIGLRKTRTPEVTVISVDTPADADAAHRGRLRAETTDPTPTS